MRYRFANRAEAEAEHAKAEAEAVRFVQALWAVLKGDTENFPKSFDGYRAKVFTVNYSFFVLLTQRARDATPIVQEISAFLAWADGAAGEFTPALRTIAYHARRVYAAWCKAGPDSLAGSVLSEFA